MIDTWYHDVSASLRFGVSCSSYQPHTMPDIPSTLDTCESSAKALASKHTFCGTVLENDDRLAKCSHLARLSRFTAF